MVGGYEMVGGTRLLFVLFLAGYAAYGVRILDTGAAPVPLISCQVCLSEPHT